MATIHDIAKIAGVSTSTVSHVVNKTRYVSPELVEKVEAAIKNLDQPPNFIRKKNKAFAAATSDAKIILLLTSDNYSAFQRHVEARLEEMLRNSDYTLLSLNYCNKGHWELINAHLANTPRIAGVIAFSEEGNLDLENLLSNQKLPVVMLGYAPHNCRTDIIVPDIFDGAYKATKHLIKSGHENIGFLKCAGPKNSQYMQGYTKALDDFGIPFSSEYVISVSDSEADIFQALDALLLSPMPLTAVLVADFFIIIPLLKYMNSHNISCPQDLSIVSLNDFDWATLHTPSITCIHQDALKAATCAHTTLLERISRSEFANAPKNTLQYKSFTLPSKLDVRGSTCGIGRGPFGEKAETADSLTLTEHEMEMIRSKNYTAAISFHYAGKSWMQLHLKGIKEIFDNLNISLIASTDAHFNPELQCKQLESIQILEPDIIIAIPTDNELTAKAFQKIAQSPSKLVLIANVPNGLSPEDYVTCVSTNEHSHGRNMGQGLGEYMLRHGLKNAGLVKHGAKNFYTTNQRDNAAEQVLTEEFPEINLCGTLEFESESEVFQKTCEFIRRHPTLEALYVSWDGPAMEVISALSECSRTDIAVVTGDLDFPIALNLAKGGIVKMLSAQRPFEQGQAIALAAANSLLNKPTPSFIGIEPIRVSCENLLKSWKQVFKEEPPQQLKQAFRQNPNYISGKPL